MQMKMQINARNLQLTSHAIKDLCFNLQEKKTYDTNYDMQIVHIKNQCKKDTNYQMSTATLSDSINKYKGFLIFHDPSTQSLENLDLIRVKKITPARINNETSRIFIIKKFEILSKAEEIIGNPELINDEEEDIKDNHCNSFQEDSCKEQSRALTIQYTPLKQLTTFSKDFQILVRVIKKSDIKNFNSSPNKNGGSLFYFVVIDEEGYEMQVTCFNKAVNKFFDTVRENKIYEISGGYVKINEKKFSSVKADYKVVIDENSVIVEKEDDGTIQYQKFSMRTIAELAEISLYTIIDTIGYILEVGEKIIKNTKNGEQPMKRLIIGDSSEYRIELTLWRAYAHLDFHTGQIIAVKNVKVGEFNGRNISTFDETIIIPDPNMKEANELKLFIKNFRGEFRDLSKSSTLLDHYSCSSSDQFPANVIYMKDVLDTLDEMYEEKTIFCRIKATVTQIMHNDKNFYPGCQDLHCKKKLTQEGNHWTCLNCNKDYSKPAYYYTLSIRVKDCSAEHWIDIFGKTAESLVKRTAEEYKELLLEREVAKLKEITSSIEFKTFYFLIKPKTQYYNSVPKKKLYAYKIENVDLSANAKRLVKSLNQQLQLL